MSASGGDSSASLPAPFRRRRRRRTRGLAPSQDWERVDELLSEIRSDGNNHQSIRLRDKS